ncbi:UPF0602 protein C4orf47 homolog isoform X4 [Elephas maximus indicus]|uniref:UPF0602 protein C4orf47 homolog isoform X4 n=1 Tax=Elephas maximus indicus TaxID=99487 RepID=UPI002115F5DF|nr:UPF0602 protein C4orf47 homolog isoform X4 [Elephas maximus indicus]
MCHHIVVWIWKLLRNNRRPSPVLQCTVKTQRKISSTWKELIYKPRKERNWIWKENEAHRHLLKGSPFKLNSYPKEYFDNNPYFSNKPLPPIKKAEKRGSVATPFKPSSPGKKAGGMKAGTFDPFPSHSADPYVIKMPRQISGKIDKIFHPPGGPKSRPMISIMTLNVKRALNMKNYKTASVQSY